MGFNEKNAPIQLYSNAQIFAQGSNPKWKSEEEPEVSFVSKWSCLDSNEKIQTNRRIGPITFPQMLPTIPHSSQTGEWKATLGISERLLTNDPNHQIYWPFAVIPGRLSAVLFGPTSNTEGHRRPSGWETLSANGSHRGVEQTSRQTRRLAVVSRSPLLKVALQSSRRWQASFFRSFDASIALLKRRSSILPHNSMPSLIEHALHC